MSKQLRVEVNSVFSGLSKEEKDNAKKLGIRGGYAVIQVLDEQNNVLVENITKNRNEFSTEEVRADLFAKIIESVLKANPYIVDDAEKRARILKELGVPVFIDGNELK